MFFFVFFFATAAAAAVFGEPAAFCYRLAVNNAQYFSSVLGIKDPIHRQKIAVKAMDVVLFGPPKDSSSYVKDATLITVLAAAIAIACYAYRSNKNSREHLRKLMVHMESLSSTEKEFQELQVGPVFVPILLLCFS